MKGSNNIEVVFDAPKNAVLVGTTAGFQLLAVLKLPEPGLSSQVASCACADVAASNAAAATVLNKCVRISSPPLRNAHRKLACACLPLPWWDRGHVFSGQAEPPRSGRREAASCLEAATGDPPKVAQTRSRLTRKAIANHRSVPPPSEDRTHGARGKRKLGRAPTFGRNFPRVAKTSQSIGASAGDRGARTQSELAAERSSRDLSFLFGRAAP
jgi:hypothetical protein